MVLMQHFMISEGNMNEERLSAIINVNTTICVDSGMISTLIQHLQRAKSNPACKPLGRN
jgi:hypothetical protein